MAEANPFAKYATDDEENPFSKYVKVKVRKPDALDRVNGADSMTGIEKFLAGTGKAFVDLGRGVGQYTPFVSRADVAESRKRDAALMDTGAGLSGNIIGGIAALAPTAMIPGANTIAGAGVLGAVTGAMLPSASTQETISNTGIGALGSAAIPSLFRAGRVAKSFVEPFYQSGRDQIVGRAFRDAAGNQADDAARNLLASNSLVNGSLPTAGEAAKNPGIAALQRTAIATDPVAMGEMALRQSANNQARIEALQRIIGDPSVLKEQRAIATEALYKMASGRKIEITPELDALFKRPIMQSAIGEAKTLAANSGRNFSLTKPTDAVSSATLVTKAAEPGSIMGRDAHAIKMALDDTIESAGVNGMGRNAKRAATSTKAAYLDQVERQVNEYAMARDRFARMSQPVNQSEVADLIMQRSTGGIQGNMTPAAFNRALNDRTAQSALGRTDATIAGTFDPQQLSILNNIKSDLKNLDYANSAGRGVGSDTVQKLAYANMMAQSGLPSAVRAFAPASIAGNVAQKFGNIAYSDANKKMSEQLARSLLDPKTVASLMKSGVTPKGLLALEEEISRLGVPIAGGLLGASNWAQ